MSGIFDGGSSSSPSSLSELATLTKDNPDLASDDRSTDDPVTSADDASAGDPPSADTGPDADPPAAVDPPAEGRPQRMVPAAALAEERASRKAMEAQLSEMKGQLEAIQRMQQPQQPPPQAQQPQEQPPDPNEDPIGALAYERRQREAVQNQLQGLVLTQRVQQDYVADAHRFVQQTPDFPQAYQHLFTGRAAELKAQGWQDQQITQQIRQEEFNLVLGALRAGRSPAQQAYELAKARGYTPSAARPAAPAAKPPTDPALQAARAAAASGIAEGGAPGKADLSLEDIANLKGAAQEKALAAWERKNTRKSSIFRV